MTMRRVIVDLHAEMKDLTIRSGVKEEHYVSLLDEDLDQDDVYLFLKEMRDTLYDATLKVWERHEKDVWNRMETMGIFHLAEQKLLKEHSLKLKRAWTDAPRKKRPAKGRK
jgi:hypothetical protein